MFKLSSYTQVQRGSLLEEIASEFDLGESVKTLGVVPYDEALQLQEDADMLLALTWNDAEYRGVLPGKFLEYLGASKPVISLVSGQEPDSELKRIATRTNIGIAVEAAEGAAGIDRLAQYLEEALAKKSEGKQIPFAPQMSEVTRYDYENIVTRLETLFEKLASSRTPE